MFIWTTDVEAETPVLWPPAAKIWLIWKDPNAAKDWRQGEKGTTEDEMVGWHHQLEGHEFGLSSGSCWWTGKPGVLQSMVLQRIGHGWATELNRCFWDSSMALLIVVVCIFSLLYNILLYKYITVYPFCYWWPWMFG